jgi:hypothetical protein
MYLWMDCALQFAPALGWNDESFPRRSAVLRDDSCVVTALYNAYDQPNLTGNDGVSPARRLLGMGREFDYPALNWEP